MSEKINVFLTGATGYIGGSVLDKFLDRPDIQNYHVQVLVRSSEKAEKLKKFGVEAIVGSYSDLNVLETLASQADVVIACADADDFPANQAILAGLKKRHEMTKTAPILIHTSGTGVLADKADGMHTYDTIWDDSNPEQMARLPDEALHRNVDLEIVKADKEGYLSSYIVIPSTIYGFASGKLVDAGIQKKNSIQIPALIHASVCRGQGGHVGDGKNLWPDVHVDDVSNLFIDLYNAIQANREKVGHGVDGYYFGENGEHSLREVGEAIGKALFELGKSKSPEATPFTEEDIQKYFNGSKYLGSNSRCTSKHSKSIGWKPKYTKEDMLASIKAEVEYYLSNPMASVQKL